MASLALLLSTGAFHVLPNVKATGPIFTVSESQTNTASCTTCSFDSYQVINRYNNVLKISSDVWGDSQGQIPTNNSAYPILEIWYFKTFVYSPSSLTNLHLYINYYVNAYVYAAASCTSAWLEGEYGVALGAQNSATGTSSYPVPMTDFEYDQAITTGSLGCSTSPSVNPVNGAQTRDGELTQSGCPNFCNFVIGTTYTFELMFEITANPGAYVIHNSAGAPDSSNPAYLYPGAYGFNSDFTNGNFCTILSYQNSPVSGCPTAPPVSDSGGGGGGCASPKGPPVKC